MDGLQRICKRESGVQYFVEHHYGLFYILTNAPMSEGKWSGEDYYLVRCRVEDVESNKWQVMCIINLLSFLISMCMCFC